MAGSNFRVLVFSPSCEFLTEQFAFRTSAPSSDGNIEQNIDFFPIDQRYRSHDEHNKDMFPTSSDAFDPRIEFCFLICIWATTATKGKNSFHSREQC